MELTLTEHCKLTFRVRNLIFRCPPLGCPSPLGPPETYAPDFLGRGFSLAWLKAVLSKGCFLDFDFLGGLHPQPCHPRRPLGGNTHEKHLRAKTPDSQTRCSHDARCKTKRGLCIPLNLGISHCQNASECACKKDKRMYENHASHEGHESKLRWKSALRKSDFVTLRSFLPRELI